MNASQILYIVAYCVFLAGAAKSFRDDGSPSSLWIMSGGVLLDFLLSILPALGVKIFQMNLQGTNAVIVFAIILGCIVWLLFLTSLYVRRLKKQALYHTLIAVVEIAWFIDFISFLYGMYKFPLQ